MGIGIGRPLSRSHFETMRGRESYDRARALGKGILGVSLHMGNYEVGPQLLAQIHDTPVAGWFGPLPPHAVMSASRIPNPPALLAF